MNYLNKLKSKYSFHGGPWDRGFADSYYGRPSDPHWYPEGTYYGTRVVPPQMTEEEVEAYLAGFEDNELSGDRKDY